VIQNLVANDSHHLETLLAADAVDDHVTVDADEVLAVQNGVFVLWSSSVSTALVIFLFSCRSVPVQQCR
jgi:hypothetical protein